MGAALDRAVELPEAMYQDRAHFALACPFAAPANETEQRLVGIWENVLAIGGLGVNDDFFELGGDSLAAITLFTEIERAFGTKPPLSRSYGEWIAIDTLAE
jgi:phthiocerol/phenolphthiocerol synthesis type-I polyketide synthase E